jgi:hypothetical protein
VRRHFRPPASASRRAAVLRAWLALLCLASGLGNCSESSAPQQGARFVFRESLTSDVIRLDITDATALIEAERLRQSGEERWVLGTLRRGDGGFNAPWSWHLDPASISFAEVTIEACQTAASAIADDIDYWIGFGQVCIWGKVQSKEP